MNRKKLLLIVLISIALLALGFAGGTYFGWTKLGKGTRSMERLFGLSGYGQYANYPEAKKVLLDYMAVLDEVKKMKGIDASEYRMCQVETMTTYIRLAITEEKNANSKESEKYMGEASKGCQDIKWKDCSPEKLRQLVERLDHRWKSPSQ